MRKVEKEKQFDILICGGGASGLLLAHALIQDSFFASFSIGLIEKEEKTTNDRTWCYWETGTGDWDQVASKRWSKAKVKATGFESNFQLDPYAYKMIRGLDFYNTVYDTLKEAKNCTLIYDEILELIPNKKNTSVRTKNSTYTSAKVFSSLPNNAHLNQTKYPVLQQHFVGWFVQTENPIFDPETIVFMDFDLPQKNNTRFMYVLPFSAHEALVEYTLFSKDLLETSEYETAIDDYLKANNAGNVEIKEKEAGSIPMTAYNFEQHNHANLLHIGTVGGWTKASTGFTFQKSVRKIKRLVEFLKNEKPLYQFNRFSKFNFFDMLFLDVLAKHNKDGHRLFTRMFQKNSPQRIFTFLDERTNWRQEVLLMSSFPVGRFLTALIRRIF